MDDNQHDSEMIGLQNPANRCSWLWPSRWPWAWFSIWDGDEGCCCSWWVGFLSCGFLRRLIVFMANGEHTSILRALVKYPQGNLEEI